MSTLTAPSLVHLSPRAGSPRERAMLDEVASRLRSRDDAVIDRVLRELVPEVRRWMFRQLGPRPDVDDATQDALSEIASALHRFEGRSSIATLAHRIALRTSYRYYHKPRPAESEPPPPDGPDVEQQVIARRALVRLHQVLSELGDRRRSAFVLCAVEGMEPSEAAEILGVSPNAARSLLCRARKDVEAALARREAGGRR